MGLLTIIGISGLMVVIGTAMMLSALRDMEGL
jgi:hypothetical protein